MTNPLIWVAVFALISLLIAVLIVFKKKLAMVPMYLVLILMMVIYLYPLLYIFNASLMTEAQFLENSNALTESFRLTNYVEAWQKARFGNYVFNSIMYTAICVSASIALNVLLAFPIARNYLRAGKALYILFLLGMFLPNSTPMLLLMFIRLGLYNTQFGYMLTMIGAGGLTFMFFVAFIKSIPRELDEAASMDGCGYIHFLVRIIVPLMRPAIATMAILGAIGVWNDIIGAVIFLARDIYYPITRGLFAFVGSRNIQWTLRIAGLVIIASPLMILYIFLQRHIIESVVSSGVKG